MANQLKMAEIQAILALYRRGWSARRIARELGVHRETVGQYVKQAGGDGSKPASALTGSPEGAGIPDEPTGTEAEPKPASALTGFSGAKASKIRFSSAWPWQEVIVQKLGQGLSVQRIYQDLVTDHGYGGSYHAVRRLAVRLVATTNAPYRRMECKPAAEAQVDFGRGAPLITPDGRRRSTWIFRIVLSHSRKGYSEAVVRQGTDEFLRCLENAFHHFGGCPHTLVIDNLRAAVTRADWFDPELCPKVRSFAEHYGLAILPTKPYMPRHKGKIERGIGYVKGNFLKGRAFPSLEEQNRHAMEWETTVADLRIHGTTRQQVIKLFTEREKPALLPLPPGRFELFAEALRNVHRDGHVEVHRAYYSVPPEYLGQRVWARWDGRTVRLFDQWMRPIAVHAQKPPGRFATLDAHIVPQKISGMERGTSWLLGQVDRIGPEARGWAEAMLQNRGVEGVRVLLGLLHLDQKHPRQEIERACRIARGHGAWHLRLLRQLIRQQPAPIQTTFEFASTHPIIRPVADYGQWVREALSGQSSTPQECAT